MSMLINGVQCDAFAHIDRRTVSDTAPFSLSNRGDYLITAFLYCDGKAFPVSQSLIAECCIKGLVDTLTVDCSIGTSGEVIIPIPEAFRVEHEVLNCEINISGTDSDGSKFRYKAADFRVVVIE